MRDTVELLESIGRDATLRHASPEELAQALEAAGASAGLRELAANGNGTILTEELGIVQMHVEHQSQTGGYEGDEVEDDHGDDKDDEPSQRPDDPDDTPPT
jgi:hypothetical protein